MVAKWPGLCSGQSGHIDGQVGGQIAGLTGSEGHGQTCVHAGLTGLVAKWSDGHMAAKWPGLCSGQSGHIYV